MAVICAYAKYEDSSGDGVDGLTVTWDIDRVVRATGVRDALVTASANNVTFGRDGLYGYRLVNADIVTYDYIFTAITASGTPTGHEQVALWTLWSLSWHDILTTALTLAGSIGKLFVDYIDAAISSRSVFDSASNEVDIGNVKGSPVTDIDDFKADVSSVSTLTAAQVNAQVDQALADIDLDHLIEVTAGSEEPTDGAYLDQIMHKSSSQEFNAASDSLEAIRDKLATGQISVVNVVGQDGNATLFENLDYYDADGKALEWSDSDGDWPDLTGATVQLIIKGVVTVACTVTNPASSATITAEIARANLNNEVGTHELQVRATLSNGHIIDLVTGTAEIRAAV